MNERGHETMVLTSSHRIEGREHGAEQDIRRTLRVHGFFGHPWLGIAKLKDLENHNNSELRSAIRDFRPDVIHVFNLGGISKSLIHTIERLGVPVAFFISDHWLTQSLDADVWLNWWNRPSGSPISTFARKTCEILGKRASWDASAPTSPVSELTFRRIYFCSEFLKKKALAWGRDVTKGEVIYNAVDIIRFDGFPAPAAVPCNRLLFVGRLTEEKGIMTVLRAIKRLRGRFTGTLTVCGRGEASYEKQLRDFVASNELPVAFTSATPAEMPAVYKQHDALIFASEWEEPFALTPLEAMASGLPVVTTTTGGSAELFENEVNSLTFTAGSDLELALQITALVEKPSLRADIASRGHNEVRARFSEARIIERIEEFLSETVLTWDGRAVGCDAREEIYV
jgi:glycogen synthase